MLNDFSVIRLLEECNWETSFAIVSEHKIFSATDKMKLGDRRNKWKRQSNFGPTELQKKW